MATESSVKTQTVSHFGDELGTEMIDIFVGPNRQLFRVHQKPLRRHLPDFENLLGPICKSKGDIPSSASLSEEDPVVFSHVIGWIYGRHPNLGLNEDSGCIENAIELYAMAESMKLMSLMDFTMTVIITYYKIRIGIVPVIPATELVYSNTHPHSKLRHLVAKCLAYSMLDGSILTLMKMVTPERFHEVMASNAELFSDVLHQLPLLVSNGEVPVPPLAGSKCEFHAHENLAPDEACPYLNDMLV